MKKTEIDVEIDNKGNVQFHVKGKKGESCLEYAEFFQTVMGPIKDKKLTSEYYEQEVRTTSTITSKIGK